MNKIGISALILLTPLAFAGTEMPKTSALTASQQTQFEHVIHDYLVSHPEVLVEASQVLQEKQQKAMQEQAQTAILDNAISLTKGEWSVAGNPNGKVTLVEFFDYQCIHCKHMTPIIENLIAKNHDLRVIFKEFPIFGQNSNFASQAALAAAMQGKYQQLQAALLKIEKPLNEEVVLTAAKTAGLNVEQLKKDMASQKIKDELAANRTLGEKLHLMGTPAFIVLSTPNGQFNPKSKPGFIPGGASEAALQELITQNDSK